MGFHFTYEGPHERLPEDDWRARAHLNMTFTTLTAAAMFRPFGWLPPEHEDGAGDITGDFPGPADLQLFSMLASRWMAGQSNNGPTHTTLGE